MTWRRSHDADPTDIGSRFRAASAARDETTSAPELLPVRLTHACVAVLPVAGAGLSLLGGGFRVPLGASDTTAEAAERLQFTQGEGPCLDAARTGRIVVASASEIERGWPSFAQELSAHTPFHSIASLPLLLTNGLRSALDLYFAGPEQVEALLVADAATVSDQIVHALLNAHGITDPASRWSEDTTATWLNAPNAQRRTTVWVAMGILMVDLDLAAAEALARLRAYAYAHATDIDALAADLVTGSLTTQQIDA